MHDSAPGALDADSHDERDARIAALTRFIDWAEREAAELDAAECGMCLQLARVALTRRSASA
jgi:hypothetical protein